MSASTPSTGKLTVGDFFSMDFPEDGIKRELVNGEIVETPSPTLPHKEIRSFLHGCFAFFKLRNRQYSSYSQLNLKMQSGDMLIPDFVISRTEEHGGPCRETHLWLEGPPDVAVEVLCPGSQWRDLIEKRREYAQSGIPEYWVFDPDEEKALFLRLESGRYREVEVQAGGVYECASVPGLRLDVEAMFRRDLAAGVSALGPGYGLSPP